MYQQENPASRLYDILLEAKNLSQKKPTESKYKMTWAKVFEIDENDLDGILQGISGVHYLYNQTRSFICEHEKLNNDRNLTFLDNIYQGIYVLNLQGNMSAFNQRITQETLTALSYMSDSIEMLYDHKKTLLSADDRQELIEKIDDLVTDFINSDLPDDLKSICTDSLSNIKNAIVHYKIYGLKGIEESTSKAIGNLYLKSDSVVHHRDDENMGKFFKIVEKVKLILTTSESAIKIGSMADPIYSLLSDKQ